MSVKCRNLRGRGSKGVALVEFAIVLPVLLLILFGIMEFGFMIYDKSIVTNASREAARRGIVYRTAADGSYSPPSTSEIQQVVNNYVGSRLINFQAQGISVSVSPGDGTRTEGYRGQPLTVTVQYAYHFLVLPGFASLLADNIPITAQTIMRME